MWQEQNNQLYKKFTFNNFLEAINFIGEVAKLAEESEHHPVIKVDHKQVELWLTTHDNGNVITSKDRDLANKIDVTITDNQSVGDSDEILAVEGRLESIKLFADGGSRGNPGPSASGFVLLNMDDEVIYKKGIYLGITTNNQAEYQALKFGLEEAKRREVREVEVYLDSLLVINQMKGLFKVKNRDLWPIHEAIKELATYFKKVTYTHVPRELNKLADAEVNIALDAEATKE